MCMRRLLPGARYGAHLFVLLGLLWLIVGANTTTTSAADMAITIQGFAFSPATITVPVGTKVTWTNQDPATHTVTSDTGAFDSKNLTTGGTFSFTFSQAGSFAYHCAIHPRMVATIVVAAGNTAPTTANAPSATTAPPSSVLPQTGAAQDNRNRTLIIVLIAAAAVIAAGTTFRLRTGKQQKN